MNILTNFNICCNVEDVLKVMKYNKNNPNYNKVLTICNEMYKATESLAEIKGAFKLISSSDIEFIKTENKYFIPCLITLGQKISDKVTSLFNENEPFKAYVLNIIADLILFNASKQMLKLIDSYIKEINLKVNISEIIMQEDSIKIQNEILNCFNDSEKLNISITESFMLKPVKSMAFYIEGDENNILCRKDSQCNKCKKLNCDYKSNKKISIRIKNKDQLNKIDFEAGKNLLDILLENSYDITSPCNGTGKCGKCKIKVIDGFLEITKNDEKLLSEDEIKKGFRLACYAVPTSDLEIEMMENDNSFDILTDFSETNIIPNSRLEIIDVSNFKDNLKSDNSIADDLNNKFNSNFEYSLNALLNLGNLYENDKFCLIKENNSIINICKENCSCFGIAIDIGTTTIAMKIVNLITGAIIGQHSMLNPQKRYGADVISRIQYANNNDKNILTNLIRNCIDESITLMCSKYGVIFADVYHVAISGNTTMQYLLLGLETLSLANSPFKTIATHKMTYEYGQIFNTNNHNCKVTLLPCISAYIGGDIVSGFLSHSFHDLNKTVMLIDIGTNGEMAIGNKDKICCVSTAAGPAFEGVNISDGIGSVDGAISKIYLDSDGKLKYSTINNLKPVGICGSGVVDIVSVGLSKGWINSSGRMIEDSIKIADINDKIIKLTKKDVREVQLAKSAIRTGIDILIDMFEKSYDDIDEVFIAGGFGTKLSIENSIKIGLIPSEFKSKVKSVGNSSLNGAIKYLLDKESDEILDKIIYKSKNFELSNRTDFYSRFINNMELKQN